MALLNPTTMVRTCLTICLMAWLSGCMMPFEPGPVPPDTSLFEEGDLILTFAGSTQSWGIALCTDPTADTNDLPYSHVEMLFRDVKGHWMLGGISVGHVKDTRLSKAIKGFQHVGVYRSDASRENRTKAAELLKQWLKDPEICLAEFDYALQDVPGRRDAFCCVGFINELHRETGLAPPFTTQPWVPNAFGRHMEDLLNIKFQEITTVDSLKLNTHFTCIAQWHNNKRDPTIAHINETIARQGFQWYEEGWRMRTSQGVHLGLLVVNAPENLSNTVRTRAHITLFAKDVHRAWSRLSRRGQLQGLNESEKQAKLEAICLSFRERHMVFVDPAVRSQRHR
jgi:hypothetical protein